MIVVIWCCHVRREMQGFTTGYCTTYCNGCMHVAWAVFWGGSRSTKPFFFCVKWLQPAMKGTSCVWRLRLRSFRAQWVPPLCSATSGCSCVRSSLRFLNLWLQIALEWLHDCCHLVLPMCVERGRFAMGCCETHCNGCLGCWAPRLHV